MKLRRLIFIICGAVVYLCGFLLGYHEGDKHALDTMRIIGCQNPDAESFQMHEIPENGEHL